MQSHLLIVNMVSVTSASSYITSASRYHRRYQSRSSMYDPWSDSTEFRGIGRGSSDCKNTFIVKQLGLSSPSRYFALLFVREFVDKRDNPEQRWVFSLSLPVSTLFYWECFENYHVLFWIRNSVLTYLLDMATVIKPYI